MADVATVQTLTEGAAFAACCSSGEAAEFFEALLNAAGFAEALDFCDRLFCSESTHKQCLSTIVNKSSGRAIHRPPLRALTDICLGSDFSP